MGKIVEAETKIPFLKLAAALKLPEDRQIHHQLAQSFWLNHQKSPAICSMMHGLKRIW